MMFPPKDPRNTPDDSDQTLPLTDAYGRRVDGTARYFFDGGEQLIVIIELNKTLYGSNHIMAYLHTDLGGSYELSGFENGNSSRTTLTVNSEPDENWIVKVHFGSDGWY
jgi:hypothetical protein